MSYSLKAFLIVFVLACSVMAETFWSSLRREKDMTHSLVKAAGAGGVFAAYAAIDYLMIVPGANYLIA